MEAVEADERTLKWEATRATYWVLERRHSFADSAASPAVAAFRLRDCTWDEVLAWADSRHCDDMSIGIELDGQPGRGVVWLKGGPGD